MSRLFTARVMGASVGALLVVFVLTPSSGAAKVVVPRSCTATHGIKTCAFSYTRHAVKWLVPKGVTAVKVTVYGAQGGASAYNGTGGLGGEAVAAEPERAELPGELQATAAGER